MSMFSLPPFHPCSPARYALKQYCRWVSLLVCLGLLSYLPLQWMIATWRSPTPEAILTLGGDQSREAFTAELAKTHPDLEIWISSGKAAAETNQIFWAAGVNPVRVHHDRRAIDTVTNFTTLAEVLAQHQIHHVYLVTSDFHMPRAASVATIVLGHRGIRFTAIPVPSPKAAESPFRIVRDVARSLLWVVTGYTGAEVRAQPMLTHLNNQVFGTNDTH
jgi:uncharacterized SAM-binding protein YcdF (DUF218 family)